MRQHQEWIEDLVIRLLCVFALDRFGDFVSDEVGASGFPQIPKTEYLRMLKVRQSLHSWVLWYMLIEKTNCQAKTNRDVLTIHKVIVLWLTHLRRQFILREKGRGTKGFWVELDSTRGGVAKRCFCRQKWPLGQILFHPPQLVNIHPL